MYIRINFKKQKLILLIIVIVGLTRLQAQIVVPATGGNALGSGGSVSYSVGQVIYTTNIGTSGSVAQGVQQPFEISTLTGLKEAKGINLFCSVYPNPITDVVQLRIDASTPGIQSMSYQLLDLQGKLLDSRKLEADVTNIVMSNLCAATYFLKVVKGCNEIKTFKIIKN